METQTKKDKAQQLAFQIQVLTMAIRNIDLEFTRECSKDLRSQASFQESAAVLNPSHPFEANELLYEQARSLDHLVSFVNSLKRCDEIKAKLAEKKITQDKIKSLFI